jgi:hypothetical protein
VRPLGPAFVLALALPTACQDGSLFTSGLDPQVCEDSIPSACGAMARCVLDSEHYLEGRFPGAQRFAIHTTGETDLHVDVLLKDRVSPGTSLRLQVSEPNCVEKSLYDSAGKDIFQDTGPDGTLTIPVHVTEPGDHLVEISADAYCSYQLRFE